MSDAPLQVTARCIDHPGCVFTGEDMRIEILITNTSNYMVGYPLAYMERRGPTIMLRDPASGRSQPQRISLADRALRSTLTPIAPGQSVKLDDVIRASQLRQFGVAVDVTAEIGVSATITAGVNGEPQPFTGKATLRIAAQAASHPPVNPALTSPSRK
ncbi:hypothetical protein [Janthinobacterium sp. RB2R34]|uniref:hypothetical protein n=1 Tax=Janthinobacterium sp. RB2R34 TaxID=3424193 RepID=UPI003F222837